MKSGNCNSVNMAIDEILSRLKNGGDGIENVALDAYLEAMSAWLEAYQRKYDEPLTWDFVARMLTAAAIYE